MRVRNAHSTTIDSHAPGAVFDVDPEHAAYAGLLRAGLLVPATAGDVRFGPSDPPPSPAAVRELVAGVNARNRQIEDLHGAVEALTAERAARDEAGQALQRRVNELEALLALRAGAPVEEGAIAAAVRASSAALTKRFDVAYAELVSKHDALAAENAKLKLDLAALLAAPAKAEAPDAPVENAKPARTPKA
jgi:hypothetical protein